MYAIIIFNRHCLNEGEYCGVYEKLDLECFKSVASVGLYRHIFKEVDSADEDDKSEEIIGKSLLECVDGVGTFKWGWNDNIVIYVTEIKL